MTRLDIGEVVRIHQAAFPRFFLTRMGDRFIEGYYSAVLDFPKHIALVAEVEKAGDLAGFVTGFQDPSQFYVFFRRRRRQLWRSTAMALIRSPSLLPEILRNVRRVATELPVPFDATELSSIAVASEGRGIGGRLLEEFIKAASTAGSTSVYLTTDSADNDSVRRFYESRGFSFEGMEERGSRRLCRYARALP